MENLDTYSTSERPFRDNLVYNIAFGTSRYYLKLSAKNSVNLFGLNGNYVLEVGNNLFSPRDSIYLQKESAL